VQLFNIYQTTKEWPRAIELAEKMIGAGGDSDDVCTRVAHFYCEQANVEIKNNRLIEAEINLKKAIDVDEKAVRPWLLLGSIAMQQQKFDDAIDCLSQIPSRDLSWLSEAVPLIEECAERLNDHVKLNKVLDEYWQQCATAYLAKVKIMAKDGEVENAAQVLLEQLKKHPTMKGFKTLMGLYIDLQNHEQSTNSLILLKELVEEQIKQRPKYKCHSCGFAGSKIHWLCPSCRKWGVVKPIKGLDGE
jgi:lipopolysaccharide biosynthesis regulator YciM